MNVGIEVTEPTVIETISMEKNLNIKVSIVHKRSIFTQENSDSAATTGLSSDYYNNRFVTFDVH